MSAFATDGLLTTGPVTENMKLALQKTYDTVSAPKLLIPIGAYAIPGEPYIDDSKQAMARTRFYPSIYTFPVARHTHSPPSSRVCFGFWANWKAA